MDAGASTSTNVEKRQGLTGSVALARLKRDGLNELPSAKPSTIFDTALQVIKEPMFLLLIGTASVYVLLGDATEAAAMVAAVLGIIGITFYQERKAERALDALRDLASPRALVIRDGERRRIAGREVVRGDLVVLSEGDRVPADGIVIEAINLQLDESLLTGESVPVSKSAAAQPVAIAPSGANQTSLVFFGSMVVRGTGLAEVKETGVATEIGKIGTALQRLRPESTRLQRETSQVVRILAVLGLTLSFLVAIAYAVVHSNLLQGILAGLTLAIAMVPEEFPVVLTIFLAMGAWRLSQQHVLTRRIPAIETLGAATVLCVDKTGTLTMNQMAVQALWTFDENWQLDAQGALPPQSLHSVVALSALASNQEPHDPMEKALLTLLRQLPDGTVDQGWKLIHEYPLTPKLLAMSRAWRLPSDDEVLVAAKGAPEAILPLCRASDEFSDRILAATSELANKGLRVLGVAFARTTGTDLPSDQTSFHFEFAGLVGLADPIRPSVPTAIQECHNAGVRVIMITGDYPVTARSIATQIGLGNQDRVITGPELRQMSDDQLKEAITEVNIFARVVPEQKLRLVQLLQARGEVVAMTGDGVNDAPALKAADIGIAMGGRGTDVAREAASLVLLDDDFSSIVNAIRLGRRIYDNLKKATSFVLAAHVPIAGLTLIPVVLNLPLVLLPLHVLFLELIIDPACSIAFESEPLEADAMKRPPRPASERLFTLRRVLISVSQGLFVLVTVLAIYGLALSWGHDAYDTRAITFSALVVGNLSLILNNRSWSATILETFRTRNQTVLWVLGSAVTALLAVLYIPALRKLFNFSVLHPIDLAVVIGAGIVSVVSFEAVKLLNRKHSELVRPA
jgi:Ca2+-transporting ATPase